MPNPFLPRVTVLGQTRGRGISRNFGLYQSDRLHHLFVLGQTGTGKSTLMGNMIAQDVTLGNGFCVIDPHSDMASAISYQFADRVLYWNLGSPHCPYGYNPLAYVTAPYRSLVASGLIDTFRKQWAEAWGVRMEHLLRYSILALLENRGASLLDIVPLSSDSQFRDRILAHVTDPLVLRFLAARISCHERQVVYLGYC